MMSRDRKTGKSRIKKVIMIALALVLLVVVVFIADVVSDFRRSSEEMKEAIRIGHDETSAESEAAFPSDADDGGGPLTLDDEFRLDTYVDNRDITKRLYIYDMDYIDMALPGPEPTIEDFRKLIGSNTDIDKKFKPIMREYVKRLFEKYPDVEKKQFYNNLKTLKVIECDKHTMIKTTISVDAVGCYVQDENTIYVLEGKEYEEGTWDYQVIFHELSHCMRDSSYTNAEGIDVQIKFNGLNYWDVPNAEAINSLFAVSLFNYDERDIAYQLQSNTHRIILSCLDNYTLSDYVNHSLTYYAQQLDEYNGDDNYALTIFRLMDRQYRDYHSTSINNEQSVYYPVYDYVSKMYLDKHVDSSMTYPEARAVMDDLIEQLLYDVPEEYNIDVDHFYEYLDGFCKDAGIEVG